MDVQKEGKIEGGVKGDQKQHEKTKTHTHVVETETTGPYGATHNRRVETDVKKSDDKSITEKVGDKVKGAGHAIAAPFK